MYYVVYGILYLLSLLPLRVLYLLSDFAFVLAYYFPGYRKKVVFENLRHAFPEKNEQELKNIAVKFYGNLTDTLIETIKLITASKNFIRKHICGNSEVLEKIYRKGKKCHLHLGHNFNWELANLALPLFTSFLCLDVYIPAKNKTSERLIRKIRQRTGTILVQATNMARTLLPHRHKQYLIIMVADQNPGNPANAYWFNFLGKPAPFLKGPEKAAVNSNSPVVFAYIHKLKRGYYQVDLNLIHERPADLPAGELTRQYVHFMTEVINRHPDMWLWSHRRWKHPWKPEYGKVLE